MLGRLGPVAMIFLVLGVTQALAAACLIKGNINRRGERIYHVPGSKWYARTKINRPGERWFCSEEEAIAAGWRPPKDQPSSSVARRLYRRGLKVKGGGITMLPGADVDAGRGKGCRIKGNINRRGECIYHVPGSRWYARVRINRPGERYFCSVEEAIAAGCRAPR